MRAVLLITTIISALAVSGCVGFDDDTATVNTSKPVLASASASQAGPATPLGVWRGGVTMLLMTTRDGSGSKSPWFGTGRAADPSAATIVLYPPSRGMFASVNPMSSSAWSVAGVSTFGGDNAAGAVAGQAQGRDVLVYVHGYNETFESAASSYAALVSSIQFSGVPILFSWPSRAALLDYVTDKDSAMYSRDALEDLLTALARDPKVGRVNLLAHSMGGMVAMEALRSIADRSGGALMSRFGAVVLANPDVDIDLFKRQAKRLGPLVQKMTVIVSANDRALDISTKLASGIPRVGSSDSAALAQTGVKVADASEFGTGIINHDIFMTRDEVRAVVARALDAADN